MKRRLQLALAAVAVGVVVVALVASLGGPDSRPSRSGGGGERIAPLRLTTLTGDRIALPRRRLGALFLTVSSCISCIASGQALGEVKARFGDRVDAAWIGIDPSDPPEQVKARRASMGNPPYDFAIDRTGTVADRFQVTALGTTIVYDGDNRIVAKLIEPTEDELLAAFRTAGAS